MARKKNGRRVSGNPARRPASSSRVGREGRFEETVEQFNARLRRDRLLGLSGLTLSLVVLLLNLVLEFDGSLPLLPGGHSELYFLAGLSAAFVSAWIAFDLGNNRRTRR